MDAINLRVREDKDLLQSYYEDKWNDLTGNLPNVSKALANHVSFIKDKYRDHSDPLNGSMNFVSPLLKYFGWYAPTVPHSGTKSDDTGQSKRYYQPVVLRWIGDSNLSIETISSTTDTKIGEGNSRRAYPYVTEANVVDIKLLNSGMTWVNNISKEEITYAPNSFRIFENTKIISTGLYHQNMPGFMLNTGHEVDIVAVQINWNFLPKGSYLKFSVSKHKTAAAQFRLLIKHSTTTNAKVDDSLYKGWAADIKELNLYNEDENKYYYEGMDLKGKITQDGTNTYTTIILESRGNGAWNDTMQGLMFNVFVPEEYYYECTRGVNQTDFIWLKDISKLGKANNNITVWQENTYIPSFPKIGDTLRVIESLDLAPGTEEIKYKEYLCASGCMWEPMQFNNSVVNPNQNIHLDSLKYVFPVGNNSSISPEFLEYYLNIGDKRSGYYTRYKEMQASITIPEPKESNKSNIDSKLYPLVDTIPGHTMMGEDNYLLSLVREDNTLDLSKVHAESLSRNIHNIYPISTQGGISYKGNYSNAYTFFIPTATLRWANIPNMPAEILNQHEMYYNHNFELKYIYGRNLNECVISIFGNIVGGETHRCRLHARTYMAKGQTLFPDSPTDCEITVITLQTID